MWMKYCKDFDHYTSLILAQHLFMCIIIHFSSHYANNMQTFSVFVFVIGVFCTLLLSAASAAGKARASAADKAKASAAGASKASTPARRQAHHQKRESKNKVFQFSSYLPIPVAVCRRRAETMFCRPASHWLLCFYHNKPCVH